MLSIQDRLAFLAKRMGLTDRVQLQKPLVKPQNPALAISP